MKKIIFLIIQIFSFVFAYSQKFVELPDGELQNVKTINLICNPSDYQNYFKEALAGYTITTNPNEFKYDLRIVAHCKYHKESKKIRDAGEKKVNYYNAYTKRQDYYFEKFDALFHNFAGFEYSFVIGDKNYGPYIFEVAYSEDDVATQYFKDEESGKAKIAKDIKEKLPKINGFAKYNVNSQQLLDKINVINIDTILAQGQQLNAQFEAAKKTMLIESVYKNDKLLFDKLIEKGADIHIKDKQGWNASMYAKIYARDNFLQKLLALGGNLNESDKNGKTAQELSITIGANENMGLYIKNKDIEAINDFFKKGFVITKDNQSFLLSNAIFSDDSTIISFLEQKGLPIDIDIYDGLSSSACAAYYQKYNSFKYLYNRKIQIKNNANFSSWIAQFIKDGYGSYVLNSMTTINLGTSENMIFIVDAAHQSGNIELINAIAGNKKVHLSFTVFTEKCKTLNIDQIPYYCNNIPFGGIQNKDNFVSFFWHIKSNMEVHDWFLSDEGFKVLTRNDSSTMSLFKKYRTELIIPSQNKVLQLKYFEENTQLINTYRFDDKTLLNYYISTNDTIIYKYLIQKGAQINQSDFNNPFITAINNNRLDVISTLLFYKADVNITLPVEIEIDVFNSYLIKGFNALSYAKYKNNQKAVDLLKSNGAKEIDKYNPAIIAEFLKGNYEKIIERIDKNEKMPELIQDTIFSTSKYTYPEVYSSSGKYFIHLLIENKKFNSKSDLTKQLISSMIDKGYEIHESPDYLIFKNLFKNPSLGPSIRNTDKEFFEKLIKAGAIVEHENFYKDSGESPLFWVIRYNKKAFDLMDLFIQNGANPNAKCFNRTITIKEWAIGSKKMGNYNKEMEEFFKKY